MENAKKYFFGPLASSAEVMIFWVMHNIEAKNFFHNVGFMGIKRRRIERRFQKYKLVLKTKCT
jgi:hypothetical protein